MGFLGVVIREDIPDREEESPRDSRVASTKECEGGVEVFGVGQLLQTVCQGFYKDSEAIIWDNKERDKVELRRKATESIWGAKGEVYNRASLGNTRSG